jgi:branched-chain amino acid transport system ATP-binding protein
VSALREVRGVSRRFGGVQALQDVSFTMREGAIKAVIGPNGAGKSTLFDCVAGRTAPDAGTIAFRGEPIQGRPPHEVARRGLARTFQHLRLFPGMSALENVMVGAHRQGRAGFLAGLTRAPWTWAEERALRARALAELTFLGAADLAGAEATSLSYGQQRAVELARALAAAPALLLLDEPAAGLNLRETADLAVLLGRVRDRGVAILVVEHDMELVMGISDEVVVLASGRTLCDGPPAAVQAHPEVIRVYLGEDEAC